MARHLLSFTYHRLSSSFAGSGVSQICYNRYLELFRYDRLPFGIASAPAIFKKTLDTILLSIPWIMLYRWHPGDRSWWWRPFAEHGWSSHRRLQLHGIRMKRSKCYFMETLVVYLGHLIDSEGLHATADKMEAIVRDSTPKNVHDLHSFHGLFTIRSFCPIWPLCYNLWTHCYSKDATGNGLQNALRFPKLPKTLYSQQRYLPL